MSGPSHAFIVWNPFQMVQFRNLAEHLPNSKFILIDRGGNLSEFERASLRRSNTPVVVVPSSRMSLLDGCFDLVFFQSPFPSIEDFSRSKLISLQYGLAKERHNYGEWRALADLNLMYGNYSARITEHFSPSYPVGNVKFAGWDFRGAKLQRAQIERKLALDSSKKNVLFMPTYGKLGSFNDLVKPLADLKSDYNIIIKMHHNNEHGGADWQTIARNLGINHLMSGGADQQELLAAADVVVSDFSGAIFDGLYAEVPVVLFQARANDVVGVQKFTHESLEFRRREEIGIVCEDVMEFAGCVELAVSASSSMVAKAELIRKELFIDGFERDTLALIDIKLRELHAGDIPPLTQQQRYVREAVQALRRNEKLLRRRTSKRKSGILSLMPGRH